MSALSYLTVRTCTPRYCCHWTRWPSLTCSFPGGHSLRISRSGTDWPHGPPLSQMMLWSVPKLKYIKSMHDSLINTDINIYFFNKRMTMLYTIYKPRDCSKYKMINNHRARATIKFILFYCTLKTQRVNILSNNFTAQLLETDLFILKIIPLQLIFPTTTWPCQ